MWRLVDERVSTRRDPRYGKADRRRLGKEIKESLAKDRRRRTEEAGAEVEALMNPGTTRTITWYLVSYRAHPYRRQIGTWGDASGGR